MTSPEDPFDKSAAPPPAQAPAGLIYWPTDDYSLDKAKVANAVGAASWIVLAVAAVLAVAFPDAVVADPRRFATTASGEAEG